MSGPDPQLLALLCDQGKYDEAEALVDRWAARIDHEIETTSRQDRETT